jgi:hypothetical protein
MIISLWCRVLKNYLTLKNQYNSSKNIILEIIKNLHVDSYNILPELTYNFGYKNEIYRNRLILTDVSVSTSITFLIKDNIHIYCSTKEFNFNNRKSYYLKRIFFSEFCSICGNYTRYCSSSNVECKCHKQINRWLYREEDDYYHQ